ncbi:hypothetical protein [Paramicrobacterium chengjingii]|uniref:hypothetical protein n=1 Tax=Paramicrobacterium chengjingii TaxID=2769067 RepID=UPI0014228031|nr:hypothetical protein [Microbacterium chengjingii]
MLLRSRDSPPIVDYQAWAAVGTTTFGKAFGGWFAIAIVILRVGALTTIAAISFLAEGEPGSSTLIALGVAVGSVAVGIALIIAVKRMRSLRTRLCPDDPRDKRPPHPRNAQRVPNPASRSHRAGTTTDVRTCYARGGRSHGRRSTPQSVAVRTERRRGE